MLQNAHMSGQWSFHGHACSYARAACRTAVRVKDQLSEAELEKLVADLALTEMPYMSPRGRPTLIFTSFTELERKFSRS